MLSICYDSTPLPGKKGKNRIIYYNVNNLLQDLKVKNYKLYYLLVYPNHASGLSFVVCLCFRVFHGCSVKLAIRNVVSPENYLGEYTPRTTPIVVSLGLISCPFFDIPFIRTTLVRLFQTLDQRIKQWCNYWK